VHQRRAQGHQFQKEISLWKGTLEIERNPVAAASKHATKFFELRILWIMPSFRPGVPV